MRSPLTFFLIFLKASLFSTGGYSNFPSLHQDLTSLGWASDGDFGQALVIGQISPGPNGLWVISLGYLSYGYPGALLALLAITLPPCIVLLWALMYRRIEKQRWVQGVMRGVSLAVIAITLTTTWTILARGGSGDWRGLGIAVGACALGLTKRVPVIVILLLAAGAGYLLYGVL